MSSSDKNDVGIYLALVAIALVLIPLMFGKRLEVSPFLLFAIIFMCNIAQTVVPEPAVKTPATTRRLFLARLAVSGVFAIVLVVIDRIARAIA